MLTNKIRSDVFDGLPGLIVRGKRTICEIHREIYDALVFGNTEKAVRLLEEAFYVGRKMANAMIKKKIYDIDNVALTSGASKRERRHLRIERTRLQNEMSRL